jgi:hypothetical protein
MVSLNGYLAFLNKKKIKKLQKNKKYPNSKISIFRKNLHGETIFKFRKSENHFSLKCLSCSFPLTLSLNQVVYYICYQAALLKMMIFHKDGRSPA